jgi:hypothetical protein
MIRGHVLHFSSKCLHNLKSDMFLLLHDTGAITLWYMHWLLYNLISILIITSLFSDSEC